MFAVYEREGAAALRRITLPPTSQIGRYIGVMPPGAR